VLAAYRFTIGSNKTRKDANNDRAAITAKLCLLSTNAKSQKLKNGMHRLANSPHRFVPESPFAIEVRDLLSSSFKDSYSPKIHQR
jgi:hypothetical protein